MTVLVTTLEMLPAALSRAIGSDSQLLFAIVIISGHPSIANLYVWSARPTDRLPPSRSQRREQYSDWQSTPVRHFRMKRWSPLDELTSS